jgi:hypothetical protein
VTPTAGEAGGAGVLTILAGVLVTVVAGALVAAATDVGVSAARARTAADAAALAAIGASPLVGGDNRPVEAAAELAAANGAGLVPGTAGPGGAGVPGGWPRRVEVRVGVRPAIPLVRALWPTIVIGAAAEALPPDGPPAAAVHGAWGLLDAGELLANPRLVLSPAARADILAGRVDPRVLAALGTLTRRHTVGVSVIRTGHSRYVAGTRRVSNHYHARAVDIAMVDGRPVSSGNAAARAAVVELAAAVAPDELGSPFPEFNGRLPGHFSDAAHRDHLHLGWRG